jgi:hypothetical protein
MREAGYAPKEERMIRLTAAVAAGPVVAASTVVAARSLLGEYLPGGGASRAATTPNDGN